MQFFLIIAITLSAWAQEPRRYTKADFINVDGGAFGERAERAFEQCKKSSTGDGCWIAYHFPAREGVSFGPFTGMIYIEDGIRLERKENPATTAVFLLVDATAARLKITRIKTLDLGEPYVFEKRSVYWLGNATADDSFKLLETTMNGEQENRDLARGALRAIAVHDAPRVIPFLQEIAGKADRPDLAAAAIANLARIRNDQSADALIDLYQRVNTDNLKEEVIKGLGRSSNRKAGEKLQSIAKDDPNPKLRQHAVRRLSQPRGD
jgi:hypothetical protein